MLLKVGKMRIIIYLFLDPLVHFFFSLIFKRDARIIEAVYQVPTFQSEVVYEIDIT